MIKAVLFDLDETLILDEEVSREAFRESAALAADRGQVDVERLALAAGLNARRFWPESPFYTYCQRIGHSAWEGLWARYDVGTNPAIRGLHDWAPGYRQAVWREALAEQGILDGDLAEAMAASFMAKRRRYPLYPEVKRLLEALHGDYRLGIVTNGVPDLQREKIAGCGVAHLFSASVVSGEIDCGKPDPAIFAHICSELGVGPAEVVMVGDNPERDVAGATAFGCKSVWVQRSGRPRDPQFPADFACTDLAATVGWLWWL
ncbi:MAG TPA: HAD family hydrolase [Symbiobacteriaceae bacterium]